jgi:hypothetical protein
MQPSLMMLLNICDDKDIYYVQLLLLLLMYIQETR